MVDRIYHFVRIALRTRPPGILLCLLGALAAIGWVAVDLPGRAAVSLPFILFIPGYLLVLALFPGRDITFVERIALSFGLSIAVVPLIALAINYSPWEIRLVSISVSLSIAVFGFALVAWIRWKRLHPAERFVIFYSVQLPHGESRLDRILNVVLVVSIVTAIVLLVYVMMMQHEGESFTELYLLGPDGMAYNYPTDLIVNKNATLIVGVANHEHRQINYTLETWLINYSYYLDFDGISDYVIVPSNQNLNITDAITIEAWLKLHSNPDCDENNNWRILFQKRGVWDIILEENRKPTWSVVINGTRHRWFSSTPVWPVDEWIHVAWTYNSSNGQMTAFLNGTEYSHTIPTTGRLDISDRNLHISGANGQRCPKDGGSFHGAIRDLRIYNRVLSENQILQNYYSLQNSEIALKGLSAWWKMEQGLGDIITDTSGGSNGLIYGPIWMPRAIADMWYIDSMPVTLNHSAVDIEDEWSSQWEHFYNFSINKEGTYKLAFLLFANETDKFMPGSNHPELASRLDNAYREAHLWVTAYQERMIYIARLFDRFFDISFAEMLPVR